MSFITAQRERLQGNLRGLIEGEVRCDEVALRLYSTDAGLFECRPLGVVYPRNRDDVAACVRYASVHGISIHARGAGTGRAGACLGHGLVLDFTKFMRRVVQVADDSVTVQPGATLDRCNSQLSRAQGRIIGPDPGYLPTTTIGSMLAVDGAGPRWLSRGFPHDTVRKLQVVLANGEIVMLKRPDDNTQAQKPMPVHNSSFADLLSRELTKYLSLTSVSKAVARQAAFSKNGLPCRFGYRVCDVLCHDGHIDLIPLTLGSEGTLAIITQAELDTIPAPQVSGIVMFLFDQLDHAMQSIPIIRAHHPASCELIDRRRITLLRDWDARFKSCLPHDAEAILVVEMEGDNQLIVGDRLHDLVNELRYDRRLCYTTRVATQPDDLALFRSMVAKSQFALYRMQHYLSGISRLEDTVVPIDRLSTFIVTVQKLFKRHELAPSFFGHVGHGQISVQPVLNLSSTVALSQLRRVAPEYYDEVLKLGGTVGSEQAFGWARTPYLPVEHDAYYPVYEQVKKMFDPKGLLNPGKVIHRSDTPPLQYRSPIVSKRHLANVALYDRANEPAMQWDDLPDEQSANTSNGEPLQPQLEVQLTWDPLPIRETTMRCNGCGLCRSRAADMRMCPVFRREMNEESTPRAKANLMRGILDGQSDLGLLTLEQSKTVADNCVHCHLCRLDCPTEVDIPKIAFQSKCAYAAAHGLSLSDRFFSYLDRTLKFLVAISCPVNWSITNRFTRWLYEKLLGLSQARKLPKLAKISYLTRAIWYKRLSKPSRRRTRKVALFVDLFANHFETRIADAAVKVLEHNGIDVYVPGRQQASGAFAIACGHRDRAEKLSRKNISLLADVIRQGYHVVTLEPTSAVCLTEEYGYMDDDADTVLVAANTSDVMTYLHHLHREGKFQLDFSPLPTTIGYHAPCRTLALERCNTTDQTPAEQLLRLVPELTVKRLEYGCCGLAGGFGLMAKNFRMSLRIGMPLFSALRDPAIQLGATECCMCKMQMEQGGNKRALHPIVLLACAYGFLPEIEPMISQQQPEASAKGSSTLETE